MKSYGYLAGAIASARGANEGVGTSEQVSLLPVGATLPVIDGSGGYRYWLFRGCGSISAEDPRSVLFVGLNPSKADGTVDDNTSKRCVAFARRERCNIVEMVNLYAWRSTEPDELRLVDDPVGIDNDKWIRTCAEGAAIIVAAWGVSGPPGHQKRAAAVLGILREYNDVYCLGTTADGTPRHPLYLKAATPLMLLAEGPTRQPLPLAVCGVSAGDR